MKYKKIQALTYIQQLLECNGIKNLQLRDKSDQNHIKLWLYSKQKDGYVLISFQIVQDKLLLYNKFKKQKRIYDLNSIYNLRRSKQQLIVYVKNNCEG